MKLQTIRDALLTIGVPVHHFYAIDESNAYIVWAEEGQADAVWTDNRMEDQALSGTVDYFTRTEFDQNFVRIQRVLNNIGLSYRLNSVQDENELISQGVMEGESGTGYIHYEWVWGLWLE